MLHGPRITRKQGLARPIVPAENAAEAAVVEGLTVFGLKHLAEVVELMNDPQRLEPATCI